MEGLLEAAAALLLGAVVGSFLNVVIHRLPRGESLLRPPSQCPRCRSSIRARHNVPVLGFLWLRGRCADCGERIRARYPLVELGMGLLSLGLWALFGFSPPFAAGFLLTGGLLAASLIDFDHGIIPDSLSLGGIAAGLLLSPFTGLGWRESLIGAAVGGGVLLAVALGYQALTRREGMGMGDVKLLAAIGAFLGWKAVVFTILIASLVGSLVGVTAMVAKKSDLQLEVPFGPFLALGAVSYLFLGSSVIRWYAGFW
jgi:leader peptidase (prepilin peptidase) / N-methyltransferase